MFDGSLHSWEEWMIVSLALVAAAGVFVVVATRKVVKLTRIELEVAKQQTEEVRRQNLEIEQAVSPRILDQSDLSALKPFAGSEALILFIPDFEARRLAGQISLLLDMAGWKVTMRPETVDIRDGVYVEHVWATIKYGDPESSKPERIDADRKLSDVRRAKASAIAGVIAQSKIEVTASYATSAYADKQWTPNLSHEAIRISVGLKPMTYFTQKRLEELKAKNPGGNVIFGNQ